MDCFLSHYQSPLGGITLAADGVSLTGLWFDGQRHFGSAIGGGAVERPLPVFDEAKQWLDLYFGGRVPGFTPRLTLSDTPFRRRVWEALLDTPYGAVVTYGAVAQNLGLPPGAARAVGGAVARNPILLIVPCHRVLAASGRLSGFAAGTARKQALLALERAAAEQDAAPTPKVSPKA